MKKTIEILAAVGLVGAIAYYFYEQYQKKNSVGIAPLATANSTPIVNALPETKLPPASSASTQDGTPTTGSAAQTTTPPQVAPVAPSSPIANAPNSGDSTSAAQTTTPNTTVAPVPNPNLPVAAPITPLVGQFGATVDYGNPLNNASANMDYLKQNPIVAKNWVDRDGYGNVIGWSHFILYGQNEGLTWDGYGTSTTPTPSITQPVQPTTPSEPQTFPSPPTTASAATPTTATPTGKLLYGTNYYGTTVDYGNPLNTMAANTDYLKQNPDVESGWTDRDVYGNIVGWSHFIIFGEHEGRTWDGVAQAGAATNSAPAPVPTTGNASNGGTALNNNAGGFNDVQNGITDGFSKNGYMPSNASLQNDQTNIL